MNKHHDRLRSAADTVAVWKPDFGVLPPLPFGWRILSLRLRLSGKWCVRVQKISTDTIFYRGDCFTPEECIRGAIIKIDDYEFNRALKAGQTSGLKPFSFDPTLTPIERSLLLADARAAAQARDPEKCEEMRNDAKLYPED